MQRVYLLVTVRRVEFVDRRKFVVAAVNQKSEMVGEKHALILSTSFRH